MQFSWPQAAGVLLVLPDGRVLTVSRKHDVDNVGLPCGKVERYETPREAAVRELEEETGVRVAASALVPVLTADGDSGMDAISSCETTMYWAPIPAAASDGQTFATSEAGRVAWRAPRDTLRGSFGAYNERLFAAFVACDGVAAHELQRAVQARLD